MTRRIVPPWRRTAATGPPHLAPSERSSAGDPAGEEEQIPATNWLPATAVRAPRETLLPVHHDSWIVGEQAAGPSSGPALVISPADWRVPLAAGEQAPPADTVPDPAQWHPVSRRAAVKATIGPARRRTLVPGLAAGVLVVALAGAGAVLLHHEATPAVHQAVPADSASRFPTPPRGFAGTRRDAAVSNPQTSR